MNIRKSLIKILNYFKIIIKWHIRVHGTNNMKFSYPMPTACEHTQMPARCHQIRRLHHLYQPRCTNLQQDTHILVRLMAIYIKINRRPDFCNFFLSLIPRWSINLPIHINIFLSCFKPIITNFSIILCIICSILCLPPYAKTHYNRLIVSFINALRNNVN